MTSQVEIISSAFVKLGDYPVNSLTTGNPIYNAAKQAYEHVLPYVLSRYPWRFAIEHQELSLLTTSPPMSNLGSWQYAFQLPTVPPMLWFYRVYPTSTRYLIFQDKKLNSPAVRSTLTGKESSSCSGRRRWVKPRF